MASVNKVIILGRLGNQPELRYTTSNRAVTELRVATNERWTDKEGNKQEKTEWHTVVVWGRQAENCERYLGKGREVYVEGRLETRNWEDQTGQKRYKTEIIANTVQFLSGRGDSEGGGGGRSYGDNPGRGSDGGESGPSRAPRESAKAPAPGMGGSGGDPGALDDDIPF